MRIAITGASGLVGTALAKRLSGQGHEIIRMTRQAAGPGELAWSVEQGIFDPAQAEGLDVLAHLAGENVAEGRWSEEKKERIRHSRVTGTGSLCRSLAQLRQPPRVLVCASAIGFYGNRGEEVLTEDSEAGRGFFPEVCAQWEDAAKPAAEAGIRVAHLRIGVVLSETGGALGKMLIPFKFGLGGRLGDGRQFISWIALDDLLDAIEYAIARESLAGPVNATAPNPVTNQEFTRALAAAVNRPALFPVPSFALRLAVGEMADEALLASARVMPTRLLAAGFKFQFPELEPALRRLLRD
jgi:hypothetical protein